MKKVSIITDSTSDLSKELLEKYDITVFPLHIHLGDKEYADGIDITPEEIYQWSEETKETPKTSALSLYDAKEYIQNALNKMTKMLFYLELIFNLVYNLDIKSLYSDLSFFRKKGVLYGRYKNNKKCRLPY